MSLKTTDLSIGSIYASDKIDIKNFFKLDQTINDKVPIELFDLNITTLQLSPTNRVSELKGTSNNLTVGNEVDTVTGGYSINTIKTMLPPTQTNKTSVMFTDKISPKSRPIRSILINESIPNKTKPIAKTECAKRPSNASSGRLVRFCKKSSDKAIKQETAKTAMIRLKFIA